MADVNKQSTRYRSSLSYTVVYGPTLFGSFPYRTESFLLSEQYRFPKNEVWVRNSERLHAGSPPYQETNTILNLICL